MTLPANARPKWLAQTTERSPAVRRAVESLVSATVVTVSLYLVLGFVVPVVLALRGPDLLPAAAWLRLLERPASLGIVGLCALLVAWKRRAEAEWSVVSLAVLAAALVWAESARVVADGRAHLLALIAILPAWATASRWARRRPADPRSLGPTAAVAFTTLVVGLTVIPARGTPHTNRLGLRGGPPNSVVVQEYGGHPLKDDYPPVTIQNNSLGYRDEEPGPRDAIRRRVLVIGDSYVWGDGVPSARDTLPAVLRSRLEALAPGRFDVTSAAYPGLGVYGYRRALEAMLAEVSPDVVVVGYLGDADLDPLDAQALSDVLVRTPVLARMAASLRVAQDLHEASMTVLQNPAWRQTHGARHQEALFRAMATFAAREGHRALLVCYYGDGPVVPGVDVIALPAPWRYEGRRSELWYAKDSHPKPRLSRMLGDWLAGEIVRPGSADGARGGAVAPSAAPVIPPGQESVILEMLGGPPDAGGCRLRAAAAQKATIEATYDCGPDGVRAVTLHHRASGPAGAVLTEQFALVAAPPTPPAWVRELSARVRAGEAAFRWETPDDATAPAVPAPSAWVPWRLGAIALTAFLIGIAACRRRPPRRGSTDNRGGRP